MPFFLIRLCKSHKTNTLFDIIVNETKLCEIFFIYLDSRDKF